MQDRPDTGPLQSEPIAALPGDVVPMGESGGRNAVFDFNERAYASQGFAAQRRYPNEELCRFMGRNFFGQPFEQRRNTRILEIGCGSGANLWMVSREGFDAVGIDLSPEGISLARRMLEHSGLSAQLDVGDMTALPYASSSFDAVLDIYSAYCLPVDLFRAMCRDVARVLKPGGLFFTYTPGKGSRAWTNAGAARLIDGSTLEAMTRETAPFSPTPHPFRFIDATELRTELLAANLVPYYLETLTRTYRNGEERFEFLVCEARNRD